MGRFDDGGVHICSMILSSSRCRDVDFCVPHRSGYLRAAAESRDRPCTWPGTTTTTTNAQRHTLKTLRDANDRICYEYFSDQAFTLDASFGRSFEAHLINIVANLDDQNCIEFCYPVHSHQLIPFLYIRFGHVHRRESTVNGWCAYCWNVCLQN